MMRAPRWALALSLLGAGADPTHAAAVQPDVDQWTVSNARARLRFNGPLLGDLGLRLSSATGPDAVGQLVVELQGHGDLTATAPRGVFGSIAGGEAVFTEGPSLLWSGGSAELRGARLRGGAGERTLEIVDARGELLFTADHMHMGVDRPGRELRLYNLDLRLSPALARRIGDPRHAGLAVAVLEVRGEVDFAGSVERLEGGCTSPNWPLPNPSNNVALVDIGSLSQTFRSPSPPFRVAITPSAELQNVGSTDVPWYEKFTPPQPPYNNDQHPLLIWNMYRISNGALEQIGSSAVKHAFFSTNTGCVCPGGNILWVGCGDTYGVGTNELRDFLGPRSEVSAYTGIWERCGSIFDPDCNGVEDIPPIIDEFDRRMTVVESDLQMPGADYYIEAWYVIRDDVDIFNTMGWQQVIPSFAGSTWSFALPGPLVPGSVVDHWVNPGTPGPNADAQLLNTGEGQIKLAMRTTDLGAGQWRYEYAIANMDFDRRINSLTMPLPPGVTATNVGFHDSDNNPATDWTATVLPGSIVWKAPTSAAAQDWGLLLNFRFQAPAAPVSGSPVSLTLGVEEAGGPMTLNASILGPAVITPVQLQSFGVE